MFPLRFFTNAYYHIHGAHHPFHSSMAKEMDMGPLFDSGQNYTIQTFNNIVLNFW
jgi:hypothetical protein